MNPINTDGDFLKMLTLLYVEDDTDTSAQLGRFLKQRAGTVITAGNGTAGLAAFREHRPAIVVTDIQMPEMDGLALAREIRGMDTGVPIIVTTAFEQTDYLLRAIEIGVDRFVAKPVDAGRLHQALLECAHRLRIEAEKAELEAQKQQIQKAESLGRMAGAIAHHFNNQLQAVMGNLEMARDFDLPREDLREVLNEAMLASRRAAEISGLMLTYLGQTSAKMEPLDLAGICRGILPMLVAALPEGVAIETGLPSPGPVIRANENHIRQVLSNLVGNAWEAIDVDGSTIYLSVRTVSAAQIPAFPRFPANWMPRRPVYACLEVSDTGCGISNPDIEKIFDPFFTSKFTGRGLGLAVVLGIVRTHAGVVTVESRQGRGSRFRVFLPEITDAGLSLPHPFAADGSPHRDKSDKIQKIGGAVTVLLVEDEEPVRKMAGMMLTCLGAAVLDAKDGVEAVEVFRRRQNDIDCILCDLTMPRMDGWKTLAAIREISPDIPVVLSSGYDKDQALAGVHPEWPQGFLGKPYQLHELCEAIQKAIKNQTPEMD